MPPSLPECEKCAELTGSGKSPLKPSARLGAAGYAGVVKPGDLRVIELRGWKRTSVLVTALAAKSVPGPQSDVVGTFLGLF